MIQTRICLYESDSGKICNQSKNLNHPVSKSSLHLGGKRVKTLCTLYFPLCIVGETLDFLCTLCRGNFVHCRGNFVHCRGNFVLPLYTLYFPLYIVLWSTKSTNSTNRRFSKKKKEEEKLNEQIGHTSYRLWFASHAFAIVVRRVIVSVSKETY